MKRKINHKYENIQNKQLRTLCKSFNDEILDGGQPRFMIELIKQIKYKTIKDLDWDYFSKSTENTSNYFFHFFILFMFFLIDHNVFADIDNLESILQNKDNLIAFEFPAKIGSKMTHDQEEFMSFPKGYTNITPFSFITYTGREVSSKNGKRVAKSLVIDGIDRYTNYLISNFLSKKRKQNDVQSSLVMTKMFKNCNNMTPDRFNDDTFEKHINMAFQLVDQDTGIYSSNSIYSYCYSVINFYLFIQDIIGEDLAQQRFKKYSEKVLSYQYIANRLKEGYEVVPHNKFDDVPNADKWILVKNSDCTDKDLINCIDFSKISANWRSCVKKYYWVTISYDYRNRTKEFYRLFDFINLVAKNHNDTNITIADIIQYKKEVIDHNKRGTYVERCLSICKKFILFLNAEKITSFPTSMFVYFDYIDSEKPAYLDTYTKEEIIRLLEQYNIDYETCTNKIKKQRFLLEYYVLVLLTITEIRKTSLLRLREDCLEEVLNSGKKEYAIKVVSKTSKNENDVYNITFKAASIIKEVLRITEEDRKVASKEIKKFLFICKRDVKRNISTLSERTMDAHLIVACKDSGIEYKPFAAIRNYYQNEVSEYLERNNLSEVLLPALTKHGYKVHRRHYVPVSIKKLCFVSYGVRVGEFNLRGTIQDNNTNWRVYDDCGSCKVEHCYLKNNYDCLMCEKFITTPKNIEYFKKQVASINEQILHEESFHEIEFLQAKKRLLVEYIAAIIEYMEENNEKLN